MSKDDLLRFVYAWETSASLTAATLWLRRNGFWYATPEFATALSVALRVRGVDLREMPLGLPPPEELNARVWPWDEAWGRQERARRSRLGP